MPTISGRSARVTRENFPGRLWNLVSIRIVDQMGESILDDVLGADNADSTAGVDGDRRLRIDRRRLLQGAAVASAGGAVATLFQGRADAQSANKLEGYANLTSVDPGQTIRFFVTNGLAAGVRSTAAFAIKRVDHPNDVQVHTASVSVEGQVTPANAWAVGCNWNETTSFTVPTSWPTGLYNAYFSEGSTRSCIPFVVKPAVLGAASKILCQVPFTTLQAYNGWGGKCLYEFRSSNKVRSYKVSFDRPHDNPEYGDLYQWVRPFIRFARRRGIEIDYVSTVDLHDKASLLDSYQMFVTVGHDEYWSREMRNNLDRFVRNGGNAAVFSGNTMYWQIRFEPNAAGAANRVITCYKDWNADPIADPARKTVEWEEFGPSYKRALGTFSQHSSIGLGWERGGVWSGTGPRPANPFVIERPDHWAFAGTGLAKGAQLAGELVGDETDALKWSRVNGVATPTGTDGAPSNFKILGIANLDSWTAVGQKGGEAVMGTFRRNGTVFNVGTVDWAKGLTSPTAEVEKITMNVIEALSRVKTPRERRLQELYQYHAVNADGGWRFVFAPSPFFTQKNTGWIYDGPAFWVYTSPPADVEGVVEIKQYHAVNPDGGWNIRYQLPEVATPEGYVYDGPAFFAHGTAGTGRYPIYLYTAPSAGSFDRVVYSPTPNLGRGWNLEGVAFYAPTPPSRLSD